MRFGEKGCCTAEIPQVIIIAVQERRSRNVGRCWYVGATLVARLMCHGTHEDDGLRSFIEQPPLKAMYRSGCLLSSIASIVKRPWVWQSKPCILLLLTSLAIV